MPTHHKVYRFRMMPNREQEAALNRYAGCRRWVWNWALARKREHYAATGKTLTWVALCAELTVLKRQPETAWLAEVPCDVLVQAIRDLERAFQAFFAKRSRFPRFKSKKRDTRRFRCPEGVNIRGQFVTVPKLGPVRIRLSQSVVEKPRSATFKQDVRGHWHVAIIVEFEMPDTALPAPRPEATVGIDLGLIDFATFSDGRAPIPAPKFYRKGQRKLRKAQRVLSRRKAASNRRAKAKATVARIHEKIRNQRNDFLHKLTTELVRSHDAICLEDLSVKGLARTKLAKSFMDAAHGEFRRQVAYKAEWNRKHCLIVDRYFPSSKTCGNCGAINDTLTLSDRHWVCECGAVHDRDRNAARNIRAEALERLAAVNAESINARGDRVRPGTSGR